jgi:hypothetical protein
VHVVRIASTAQSRISHNIGSMDVLTYPRILDHMSTAFETEAQQNDKVAPDVQAMEFCSKVRSAC